MKKENQLSNYINTHSTRIILKDAKELFCNYYSKKSYSQIKKVFFTMHELFNGYFTGYQKCNTEYHNFEHTMEAFQACLRILDGYNIQKEKLPEDIARCILIATLFHDTGYIMEEGDVYGTGAKYTNTHVERSIDFFKKNFKEFYIQSNDVDLISSLIKGTNFAIDFDDIQFSVEIHKIAGSIVATADILGQMSNRHYLEKLLFLYYEFKEANIADFTTEYDLVRKTVNFYEITMEKFVNKYMNMYEFAKSHFKTRYNIDRNLYIEAVEKQIDFLYEIIGDDSSNFRHKLRRDEKFQSIKNREISENYKGYRN